MRKLQSQSINLGLLPLGLALACATVARADYYPIALTPASFNADVVVENTAGTNFNRYVTATMDGGTNNNGSTFYENGYNNVNQPWTGLPVHGSTFTAISNTTHQFTMPSDYTVNNAVLIGNYAGYTTGTLTLTAPTALTNISILASAGNGPVTNTFTIHYAGGGTQPGTMYVDDWTGGTNIAWFNNGRVNMDNGTLASLAYTNGTNRRLFFYDTSLSDTVDNVTSIDFTYVGGGRAVFFGLSGATAAGPNFTPLAVSGFNKDVVVEATAPVVGFAKAATFSMDGGPANTGNTWYEIGFNRANPTHGIPHPGTPVTGGAPLHTFNMPASYTVNNVVGMAASPGWSNATITLTAPASYAQISFLASSGNGSQSINGVIHHSADPDEPFSIIVPDWFNGANPLITASGRFVDETLTFNNEGNPNPRIYAADVSVSGLSSITSIDLNYASAGGASMIFALAGATILGNPLNPVGITGYNADGIVEASLPDPRFPYALTSATTVSMDGGTNNTGNTWYEQGYYPQMATSGLPPAGSTITSIGLPDHHYQLPASWSANNAIYVDSAHTNADLVITSPRSYFALSFLNACANGSVTNAAIMQYADGTTESNFFVGGDWFNGTPYAYSSHGRVNLNNQTINADDGRSATPNPRLYEAQFPLGNTFGTAVTNIHLQFLGAANLTSGRIVIMAVAGTTNPPPPIIGSINPTTINTIEGRSTNILVTIAGGLQPMTFQWQAGPIGAGTFTNITDGGVYSGTTTTNVVLTSLGFTNTLDYRLAVTNAAGFAFSGVCTINVLSGLPDVFAPTDPISAYQPSGGSSPGAESVDHAIDGVAQKYLNFGALGGAPFTGPVGFIASPQTGKTIVTVMRLFTANDATERDPADYVLEGSNDGGVTWTAISSGSLALPLGRNGTGGIPVDPLSQFIQEVRFSNSTGYLSYRWSVNNVRNNGAANSMQIGEVQLLGVPAPTPPIITRQPNATVTVFAGTSPTFSVGVIGYPPPLVYQWYQGASPIPGATSSSYTKANVQVADSGTSYSCTITNINGVTNSTSANLTVIAAPVQPYPVAILADHPVAYWRLDELDNGTGNSGVTAYDHVGGNNGSYTNVTLQVPGYNPPLDSDTAARFGDFTTINGVQDNFVGGVSSLSFAAPSNNNVAFSVEAWVNGPLANSVAGAGIVANGYGGGGEQFALDCGGPTNALRFYFRDATIGNPAHNVSSSTIANDGIWHHVVAVVDEANGIEYIYVDGIRAASTAFSPLIGVRSQTTPLTIGSRASSATTNENQQFVGSIDDVAIYNTALSSNQVLNHWFASHPAPLFSVVPANTTAAEGSTATLFSSAYGPAPLTYQWYDVTAGDPGTALPGKTTANLAFQNAQTSLNGTVYRVVASNPYGSTTSPPTTGAGALLTIISGPPQILADIPPSQLVYAGGTLTLAVTVGGTAPFTYQWNKNGSPLSDGGRISGAHTATLTIVVTDASDTGNYQLHITNGQGATDSTLDAVTIESVPDFNGTGLGWTLNGTPSPASFPNPDVLQLTFGNGGTARSAFYDTPLYIGSFYAEATYQVLTGIAGSGADGVTFCLQNDPRGPTALGGGGGALGVSGVAPSAEFEINIYPPNSPGGAAGGSYAFHVNGANGGFLSASPVVLDSGDPIKLSFQYNGSTLTVTMRDQITAATFSAAAPINLPAALGANTAYVGFTGADGGVASTQVVTNFMYIPFPQLTVQHSGGNVVLSWLSSIGGYTLQSNSAVNNPAGWTAVGGTITQSGGFNQVTVPSSAAAQYYRLILNLPGN
jgi:hypothetical protein